MPTTTFTRIDAQAVAVADIARRHLFIDTLDSQGSDSLDFHDVSVHSVRKALEAAFAAGRATR